MPFDPVFNDLYDFIKSETVRAGVMSVRGDEIAEPGNVLEQIYSYIRNSLFIIGDVSKKMIMCFMNWDTLMHKIKALAEALRNELMHKGIDVLVSSPGAGAPPKNLTSIPEGVADPWPVMQPEQVVQETLDALERRSLYIPGWKNRLIQFALTRLMSRELATKTMDRFTHRLYGSK